MAAEGIITRIDEVDLLDITHRGAVADVWLHHPVTLPQKRVLTSGCAGGVTFSDLAAARPPLNIDRPITPDQILALMGQLQAAANLYRRSQGVHTSALSDGTRLLAVAEDVGRHNTLDKIRGACLQQNIPTAGNILLTTGRVSSEMLHKAAGMQTPVIVSRTSPTSLSLALAQAWNITLIGYARGRRMRVYSGEHRFGLPLRAGSANGHRASPPS
ncbi:MAG: formate dehydrogenase accessory sulfurtransferase FdhD [Anaerolineae bacterium]